MWRFSIRSPRRPAQRLPRVSLRSTRRVMVTQSCHQVKPIRRSSVTNATHTTRLVDTFCLLRCPRAPANGVIRTSFNDPSSEAGKESPVAPRNRGAAEEPVGQRELLAAADVARTIARMAHQVIEKTSIGYSEPSNVVLLGIPTRGVPLATRLAERIREFTEIAVPTGVLDVTLYRDDLR